MGLLYQYLEIKIFNWANMLHPAYYITDTNIKENGLFDLTGNKKNAR